MIALRRLAPGLLVLFLAQSLNAAELPRGKDWKKFAPIPRPGFGMAAVVVGEKLHVLGGSEMDAHQVYDPRADAWSQSASLPASEGVGWPMAAPFDGKIYLFGGGYGKQWRGEAAAWVYDPAKDRWAAVAPMPERRMQGAAVAANGAIYIIGGHKGSARLSREEEIRTVYRYDPATDRYARVADMPETGIFIVSALYKGKIYLVPGVERTVKDPGPNRDGYVWADGLLKYEPSRDRWTKLSLPRPQKATWLVTQQASHAALGARLILAGGGAPPDRRRSDLVFYFDMERERFGTLGRLPEVRCCATAGVIGGKLYVVGGFYHDIGQTCPETWGYPFADERTAR